MGFNERKRVLKLTSSSCQDPFPLPLLASSSCRHLLISSQPIQRHAHSALHYCTSKKKERKKTQKQTKTKKTRSSPPRPYVYISGIHLPRFIQKYCPRAIHMSCITPKPRPPRPRVLSHVIQLPCIIQKLCPLPLVRVHSTLSICFAS